MNAEIHARHLRRNTVTASKKGNEANTPPPLDTQRWITFRYSDVRNIKVKKMDGFCDSLGTGHPDTYLAHARTQGWTDGRRPERDGPPMHKDGETTQ